MKQKVFYFIILIIGTILFSCSNNDDNLFVIKVDSLKAPVSVTVNDTITLNLFGTIGTNGCYSFSHLEDKIEPLAVDLTAWGNAPTNDDILCPDVMIYLNEEYKIATTQKGTFIIRIHQPNNSVLMDSVIVN